MDINIYLLEAANLNIEYKPMLVWADDEETARKSAYNQFLDDDFIPERDLINPTDKSLVSCTRLPPEIYEASLDSENEIVIHFPTPPDPLEINDYALSKNTAVYAKGK
jgi:hypothetical protein